MGTLYFVSIDVTITLREITSRFLSGRSHLVQKPCLPEGHNSRVTSGIFAALLSAGAPIFRLLVSIFETTCGQLKPEASTFG